MKRVCRSRYILGTEKPSFSVGLNPRIASSKPFLELTLLLLDAIFKGAAAPVNLLCLELSISLPDEAFLDLTANVILGVFILSRVVNNVS